MLGEAVIYDADSQTYRVSGFSFGPANRVADKDAGDLQAYGAAQPVVDGKIQYSIGLFDGETDGIELTYASFMRVLATRTNMDAKATDEKVDYIGFGNFTPPDQLPRSGSATYAGRLFGDIDDGSKLVAALTGRSDLTANFETGALAASLFPTRVSPDGSSTALGRYDFAGSIDAFTAAFTGMSNQGTGSLTGRFYGSAAQEYGAVFNIQDPAVGNMTGITLGKRTMP